MIAKHSFMLDHVVYSSPLHPFFHIRAVFSTQVELHCMVLQFYVARSHWGIESCQ